MELSKSAREFILHWGEMGNRWGVNRTVAQVHALLYLTAEPLTPEEIAETLQIARSNVSTSLQELLNWELAQATHRMGDRRTFFSTSHDVWQLFLTVVEQRVEREIEPTIATLGRLASEPGAENEPQVTARIAAMHDFLQEMHDWYGKMSKLPPSTLRSLIGLGAGVTRWLPGRRRAKREGEL
jgi:DNA-binding transcriptional regulator GbsR (MarR family)